MEKIAASDLLDILRQGDEIAVIDIRPQEEFIRGQLLASVNVPYDRLDIEAFRRIPRRSVRTCIVAGSEAEAEKGVERLSALGYDDVVILQDGLASWSSLGFPLFEDVNAESKCFGEFIEHAYGTPNLDPSDLYKRKNEGWQPLINDCRPAREHIFAHIPGAVNVPGGDVYKVLPWISSGDEQDVVIHCGGRTRGIIAAQGIVNAGFANPVSVLTNGTMGWHLSGYDLETGEVPYSLDATEAELAGWTDRLGATVGARFGVEFLELDRAMALVEGAEDRTLYLFDLRNEAERRGGDVIGTHALAGQLIQATDEFIAVRGARVILVDDDLARGAMTASWLRQLGWRDAFVLPAAKAAGSSVLAEYTALMRTNVGAGVDEVDAATLKSLSERGSVLVVDVSQSHEYLAGHVPGAVYCPRSALGENWGHLSEKAERIVLSSTKPEMSSAAAADIKGGSMPMVLAGGTPAWAASGEETRIGVEGLIGETSWLNREFVERIAGREELVKDFVDWELERFFDPATTKVIEDAMKKYLRWEIDLVDDWHADGTAHFARIGG